MKPKKSERNSIHAKLRELIRYLAVPLSALSVLVLLVLLFYGLQYSRISSNISTASQFNQNFKDEVDLKMYYFVSGSSTDLPRDEVDTAEELAAKLLANTRNREGRRAANSVLNLCSNLKSCIDDIQATDGYDMRIHQLENNVYVITELIQEYVYTYLYHEAGELARLREMQSILLISGLLLTAGVIIVTVFFSVRRSLTLTESITKPIDELYHRITEIGQGDLAARPPVVAEDEKLRALGTGLEEMALRLTEQMELNRLEQERLRSMELSLVQSQINPHFLYNTLDAIMWLVETGKNEQAVEMVSSLSNYFRSFLSNGKDIITLREEALHVRSYLEIQQVRYKDILHYELDMDPALDDFLIPKMTLQPLVENAIYHGIKPRRGGGAVSIRSAQEGSQVLLEVRDTGVGMSPEALQELNSSLLRDESSGFGVMASYKRLKLMFGDELHFVIDSREGEGTVVSIRIPSRMEEEP